MLLAKSAKKRVGKPPGKTAGGNFNSGTKGTVTNSSIRQQADALRLSGQFFKALDLYERHLVDHPEDLQALLDKGSVLMSLERFTEAAQVYSKMVEIKPDETALSNLGAALIRLGRANEAKVVLDYALEINPKNIYARINLGGVLQALGMHQENLQNALEAVSIDPTQPLAFNNLGSALFDLAKFPEAKHAFETATLLDSKNLDAHINLANIESKLGAPQASIAAYQKALSLLPPEAKQRAEAIRFYMSFEYLKQGMLPEGWDCYEGGFSNLVPVAGARHPRRQFAVPRWNGEMLNGKTLLVWREQGLGDELLFATCLHELEALGGRVIVECDKRLIDTFTRSFPQYTVRSEAFLPDQGMQSPHKDFDLHVPLGSLMKHFRRDIKAFERSGAYIKTDPVKVAKFAERLAPYKDDYRLVGICWRSGKLDPVRNLGYTTLDEWGEVLQTPGFKFVNLQYGDCEAELQQAEEKYGVEILRWPDLNLKDDLDDVFALMHCLDVVVTVQTAVLSMAASVGPPVFAIKADGWTSFGFDNRFHWYKRVRKYFSTDSLSLDSSTDLGSYFTWDDVVYGSLLAQRDAGFDAGFQVPEVPQASKGRPQGSAQPLVDRDPVIEAEKTLRDWIVCRKTHTGKSTDDQALLHGCKVLAAFSEWEKLESYVTEFENSSGNTGKYRLELAFNQFMLGMVEDAESTYQRTNLGRLPIKYKINYSLTLAALGRVNEAILLLDQINTSKRHRIDCSNQIGMELFHGSQHEASIEVFERNFWNNRRSSMYSNLHLRAVYLCQGEGAAVSLLEKYEKLSVPIRDGYTELSIISSEYTERSHLEAAIAKDQSLGASSGDGNAYRQALSRLFCSERTQLEYSRVNWWLDFLVDLANGLTDQALGRLVSSQNQNLDLGAAYPILAARRRRQIPPEIFVKYYYLLGKSYGSTNSFALIEFFKEGVNKVCKDNVELDKKFRRFQFGPSSVILSDRI